MDSATTTTATKYTELIESVEERLMALSADIIKDIKEQISVLAAKEQKLEKLDEMMEQNAAKAKKKIVLDVGGKRYATSKDTLLSVEGTYFTGLLGSGRWQPDDDGSYFIDRNGKLFVHILEYLRTGKMDIEELNTKQKAALREEMDFYMIPFPTQARVSDILSVEHAQQIEQWMGGEKKIGQCLWKATEHGFGADQFHSRCDNKGSTVVIVQSSEGYVFGGYAHNPWNSNGTYRQYTESFLFTLTNPHGIIPTRFADAECGMYSDVYGLTFGSGHDIHINNNSNTTNGSYSNFGTSYHDTTGLGERLFTGRRDFRTKEIEVYRV